MSNDVESSGSRDYGAIFRRRLPYIITIAPAIILASVYLAFSLPAEYRSSATIMLEPSSVQSNLVETTVATYASHQIEIVQGKVMTVDALKELVAKDDPYPQLTSLDAEAKALKIIGSTTFERVDPVTMRTPFASVVLSCIEPDSWRAAFAAARRLSN